MARAWCRLFGALAVVLATGPVCGAAPRAARDDSLRYEHPKLASIVGLGTINPKSSTAGRSLQTTVGLRYLGPDLDDPRIDSVAWQLTGTVVSSRSEDIYGAQATILHFLPRSSTFPFDNHLFYGAGVGSALVHPLGREDLVLPEIHFEGGLQSRIRDWHLETAIQLVVAPKRRVYDMSGTALRASAVYHFDM